jgi:hypothetical protein
MFCFDALWELKWNQQESWVDTTHLPDQWKRMWELIGHPAGEALVASLNEMLLGAHDASWLMAYDYGWHECGLEYGELLEGLLELAECCGWWAPYKDAVILQHRPCEIHLEKHRGVGLDGLSGTIAVRRRRLHNADGMAVKFRDGWGLYCAERSSPPGDKRP